MTAVLIVAAAILVGVLIVAVPVAWARLRHGDPYDVTYLYRPEE